MGFEEVDRKPLYLQVAEQIREAILRGDLAPGARLPTERELGGTFGVSRASVREALRSLQAHGLISGAGRIAPSRTVVRLGELDSLQEAIVHLLRLREWYAYHGLGGRGITHIEIFAGARALPFASNIVE